MQKSVSFFIIAKMDYVAIYKEVIYLGLCNLVWRIKGRL